MITWGLQAVFTAAVAIWSKLVSIRKNSLNWKYCLNPLLIALTLLCITGCEEKAANPALPGMEKAIVCMSCHGLEGNGHGAGAPRLAGQYSDYLIEAMNAYADGRRKHDLMKSFVAGLSERDIQDLADFYSSKRGL